MRRGGELDLVAFQFRQTPPRRGTIKNLYELLNKYLLSGSRITEKHPQIYREIARPEVERRVIENTHKIARPVWPGPVQEERLVHQG